MKELRYYWVLKNIELENANAIAGITWGFPAITQFLGFTHALQRQLPIEVQFEGVGVICHHHQPQAYKNSDFEPYRFALTRNPLNEKSEASPFVEEGRTRLNISLVIGISSYLPFNKNELTKTAIEWAELASGLRLAGGSILDIACSELLPIADTDDLKRKQHQRLMYSLLPGYALVSREDLLAQAQQNAARDKRDNPDLQAWLDFSALTYRCQEISADDKDSSSEQQSAESVDDNQQAVKKVQWHRVEHAEKGWFRPIAVGYQGISDLYKPGEVARARDGETPFRFVENLYSLGQWLNPLRIQSTQDLLWCYGGDPEAGLYIATNAYSVTHQNAHSSDTQI